MRYRQRNNVLSFVGAIVLTLIGFAICMPFFWLTVIVGMNFHYVTLLPLLMISGLIVGGPMFMFGLISLLRGNHVSSSASTAELDIGRIRYAVETEKRK